MIESLGILKTKKFAGVKKIVIITIKRRRSIEKRSLKFKLWRGKLPEIKRDKLVFVKNTGISDALDSKMQKTLHIQYI